MSNIKDRVTWVQLLLIISIGSSILGIIWLKLEKIDDGLGEVKTDIAVIKQAIRGDLTTANSSTSLLDRMFIRQ